MTSLADPIKTVRFAADERPNLPPSQIPAGVRFTTANSTFIESREAAGVWVSDGYAWKIYKTQNTLAKVRADITTASNASLPLVPIQTVNGQKVPAGYVFLPVDSAQSTFGFAVKTQYLKDPYVFFSAQGTGLGSFQSILDKITNKTYLERYKAALEIAVRIKLSDPQGFMTPAGAMAFFDIHIGSASKSQELLDRVNARIAKLP